VLDSERLARCDAAAELRLQKVASVMRDHKLVLFQAKEFELEQQVAALEVRLLDSPVSKIVLIFEQHPDFYRKNLPFTKGKTHEKNTT